MFADTVKLTIGSAWSALSDAGIRYIQAVAAGPPIPPRGVQNSEASVSLLKSAPCDGGTSIGLSPAKAQLRRSRWQSRGQKSHPPNSDRSGAPDTQQPASDRKGSRRSEHTSDGLPCSLFTPAPGLDRLSTSPFATPDAYDPLQRNNSSMKARSGRLCHLRRRRGGDLLRRKLAR
jgi:hypothetical protein